MKCTPEVRQKAFGVYYVKEDTGLTAFMRMRFFLWRNLYNPYIYCLFFFQALALTAMFFCKHSL